MNRPTGSVRRLIFKIRDSHFAEENIHKLRAISHIDPFKSDKQGYPASTDLHKTTQSKVIIGNDTLNLVELGQMCRINTLVTEHPVDGEVSCRWRRPSGPFLDANL